MKLKLQLALSCFLFSVCSVQAQVSNYNFNQTITSYSAPLTGTFIGHAFQDDTVNTVNLPFAFNFNGNSYNTVHIHSNGFISFNPLTATVYNPISDPSTQNVISGFGQDLMSGGLIRVNLTAGSNTLTNASLLAGLSVGDSIFDYGGDFTATYPKITNIVGSSIVLTASATVNSTFYDLYVQNGAIRMQLAGATPTRVCEIEYRNFTRFDVFNEVINFKIRLHELNDRITIVYGNAVPGADYSTSEIGLKGTSLTDFHSREVSGLMTYITSVKATNVTDGCEVSPQKMPSGNVSYIWQPPCTIPNFSVTQNKTAMCLGDSAVLTASPASSYSWTGIGTSSMITVTPTVTTTYTLVAYESMCSSTVYVTQTVSPFPTITTALSKPVICALDSVSLSASGAETYSWTGQGTGSTIVVSPATTTSYSVQGTAAGCEGSAVVTVSVGPSPDLKVSKSHSVGCFGAPISLTASGASTYSWNTGANNAVLSTTLAATTSFTLTGAIGSCTQQVVVTQDMKDCTSLNEYDLSAGNKVFPVPFSSELRILNSAVKKATVEISDVNGKKIFAGSTENGGLVIDTDSWSSGVYFYTLSEGSQRVTGKVVKQ